MSDKIIETIPEKIIVGLDDKFNKNIHGYVTFRYKGKYRCGKNLIHNFSKFPDGPKELDNFPIEGFKIFAPSNDYRTQYTYYKEDLIDIQDPRGFLVSIGLANFVKLIKTCDVIGGTLCGQYVYSWDNNGVINLISTESDVYKSSVKISNKNIDRNLKADDMIPGSLYRFKSGKLYYNLRGDIDNDTATFLGAVKLAKEFGKKFETAYLFTNIDPKSSKNFVFCGKPENVDYEIEKNHISEIEVKDLIKAFKQTAYSWDFWNPEKGVNGCVKKFMYLPNTELSNKSTAFTQPTTILDGILDKDNEFIYVKSYIEYRPVPPSMIVYRSIERTDPQYYPAYKFSIINGVLVSQKVADLGKLDNKYRYYWGNRDEKTIDDIYIYSSKEERDKVKKSVLQEKPTLGIIYETEDGKLSDSLQIILSTVQETDIVDPWKVNSRNLYYSRLELPENK